MHPRNLAIMPHNRDAAAHKRKQSLVIGITPRGRIETALHPDL